jgi:2-polyprenyl-3-methyl-5-hydroxy-6-metoxy-1,4-benzoquinol methylase
MKTRIYEDLAGLYQLWRDTCLGERGSEKREAEFVKNILEAHSSVKTVIDLGGGIGLHSRTLTEEGFDVTLLDQSEKALSIAKESMPSLKTVASSFETLDLDTTFDASICMWSTLSYVPKSEAQKHFYSWLASHTNSVIILDEPNFSLYPSTFHKVYEGEDFENTLKITRDWKMTDNLKVTDFIYEVQNKTTGVTDIFNDSETQQYVTQKELQSLLGEKWKLESVYGDYDLKAEFRPETSTRMIYVFTPKD